MIALNQEFVLEQYMYCKKIYFTNLQVALYKRKSYLCLKVRPKTALLRKQRFEEYGTATRCTIAGCEIDFGFWYSGFRYIKYHGKVTQMFLPESAIYISSACSG